jgi:transcriptional regulator with XRE-family HTH domain
MRLISKRNFIVSGKAETTPLDALIGGNARRIREAKRRSQRELADFMECSPNFISQLEAGKSVWKSKWITLTADFLGVDPAELLGGEVLSPEDRMDLALLRAHRSTLSNKGNLADALKSAPHKKGKPKK